MVNRRSEKPLFANKATRPIKFIHFPPEKRNMKNGSDNIAHWKNNSARNDSQKRADNCEIMANVHKTIIEYKNETK